MPVTRKKTAAFAGSIMMAALIAGVPADAAPTKSQGGEHMSDTAKARLKALGYPGATGDVVGDDGCPPVETKGCG